jgi:hypothetical protein
MGAASTRGWRSIVKLVRAPSPSAVFWCAWPKPGAVTAISCAPGSTAYGAAGGTARPSTSSTTPATPAGRTATSMRASLASIFAMSAFTGST